MYNIKRSTIKSILLRFFKFGVLLSIKTSFKLIQFLNKFTMDSILSICSLDKSAYIKLIFPSKNPSKESNLFLKSKITSYVVSLFNLYEFIFQQFVSFIIILYSILLFILIKVVFLVPSYA